MSRRLHTSSFFSPFWILVLLILINIEPAKAAGQITLEVYKAQRLLLVKRDHTLQRTFRIASGSGGSGNKLKRGDNKTPIGAYRIVHFKEDSRFHYFMQLNYPNAQDIFAGMQRKQLDPVEYDTMVKQMSRGYLADQRTTLGGAIGIHGLAEEDEDKLKLHHDENWTQGCVAMTNEEIDELRQYVKIGTPVFIFD